MADMPQHRPVPRSNAARICTIVGFVFAVLALLLNPLIFGVLGVMSCGIVGAVLGRQAARAGTPPRPAAPHSSARAGTLRAAGPPCRRALGSGADVVSRRRRAGRPGPPPARPA